MANNPALHHHDNIKSGDAKLKKIAMVKAEWESTVDSLPQLLCLVNAQGTLVRVNKTLENWGLGNIRNAIGNSIHYLLHPGCEDKYCYLNHLVSVVQNVILSKRSVEFNIQDRVLNKLLHIQINDFESSHSAAYSEALAVVVIQDRGTLTIASENAPIDNNLLLQLGFAERRKETQGKSKSMTSITETNPSIDLTDTFKLLEKIKREWESTVDSLPQVICLLDNQGKIIRANRTIERWRLGHVNRIKGLNFHELLHPSCHDPSCYLSDFLTNVQKALDSKTVFEMQAQDMLLIRYVNIQFTAYASQQTNEGPHVVAVVNDISELKRSEREIEALNQALEYRVESRTFELLGTNIKLEKEIKQRAEIELTLRKNQEIYLQLIETMTEGFLTQDHEGKITYANHQLCDMINCKEKSIIGMTFDELISKPSKPVSSKKKSKAPASVSYEALLQDQQTSAPIRVQIATRSQLDDNKQLQGSFSVITLLPAIEIV